MRKPPLNVFVGRRKVGAIHRSEIEPDTLLFGYDKEIPDDLSVSLTVPPRVDHYDSMAGLLPIFDMNLPEGGLKERLRYQFSKTVPEFDDLDMLAIVGTSQIGRLRYSHQEEITEDIPAEDTKRLLTHLGSEDLFASLLERFAQYSGVSGVQPKVLIKEIGQPDKLAQHGATHIVKSFNSSEFPELAANEYLCTAGAKHAGIDTAKVEMSVDRKLLLVTRFDRTPEGEYLGIEDFCVLTGRRSHGRYDGTYEEIGKRITDFVSRDALAEAREQYALSVAFACAIENGDAHLKNFSVLYANTEAAIRLAPAYDLVSTTPYRPRDTLALTLNGSKSFPNREGLVAFIRRITGKSQNRAGEIVDRAISGAQHVSKLAQAFPKAHRGTEIFSDSLTKSVQRGIERLRKRASAKP